MKLIKNEKGDLLDQAWNEFLERFSENSNGSYELFELFDSTEKLICKHCRSREVQIISQTRNLACLVCKKKTCFTAGTIFHGVKNVKALLGAMWLMDQDLEFSINRFSRLANIAYASAWKTIKKLQTLQLADVQKQLDAANVLDFEVPNTSENSYPHLDECDVFSRMGGHSLSRNDDSLQVERVGCS